MVDRAMAVHLKIQQVIDALDFDISNCSQRSFLA